MTHYLKNELDQLLKSDINVISFIQEFALNGFWFWDIEMINSCWLSSEIEKKIGYCSIIDHSLFAKQLKKLFSNVDWGKDEYAFPKTSNSHLHSLVFIHKNGSQVKMDCICMALYDTEGNPNRVLGANILLNKPIETLKYTPLVCKVTDEALYKSQVLFVVRINMFGNYIFTNDHFNEVFGLDRAKTLGTNSLEFVIEEDHERCRIVSEKCLASPLTPQNVILRKRHKNGEINTSLWEFTAYLNEEDNSYEILCIGYNISEKVKAENDLSILMANKSDLLITVNKSGIITYISPNVTKLYDYELNEIIDKNYVKLIHPKDLKIGINTVKKAIVTGIPFKNLEIRLKRKDGSFYWANINASINPVNNETILVINDVTDKKKADQELKRTKDLLEETNRVAKIGGWELNLNTNTLYWSEITKEIHDIYESHYEPDVIKAIDYYKDEKSRAVITDAVENCIQNGIPYDVEVELITTKKRVIWVRTIGKADFKDPNKKRIYGTFQDITESKEAAIQLQRTKELLEETGQIARIGGWSFDVATKTIYWSRVVKEIFGLPDDFNPTLLEEAFSFYKEGFSRELVTDSVQHCIECGTPFEIEVQIVNTKGEDIWVKLVGKAEKEEERIKRIYGTFQDINQVKIAEESKKNIQDLEIQLTKEKQNNQLKSRFVSLTSHEFRTPLSVILGSSELLGMYLSKLEDQSLKDNTNKQLNNIITQVKRLTSIVNDILNLGKTAEGKIVLKKQTFRIKEFLERIASEFQHQSNEYRSLKLFLPADPKEIISDESILRHIVSNLVGNAFKYSRNTNLNPEVHLCYFDDYFILKVKDYGMGIPLNEQKYLFETFFRASNVIKTEGTGLGLNIAKEFTEKLNGEISFVSEEGHGCTFTLKFPYTI